MDDELPLYQRMADDALEMWQRGLSFGAIGRAWGTDAKVAKKAVQLALGPNAPELKRRAHFKEVAEEALALKEAGWSLRQIGKRVGLSAPMVMRALAWARKQQNQGGAE